MSLRPGLLILFILTLLVCPQGRLMADTGSKLQDESVILSQDESVIIFDEKDSLSSVSVELSLNDPELYPRSISNPYKFKVTELIVPGTLITLGSIGLSSGWKKHVNQPLKNELQKHGHHKLSFDDYLLFAPAVVGYGLNLFGVKGSHNIADATIIYGTAYVLLAATLLPLKYSIDSPRPNLENNHSFPSGHTAIAFCGAELMRREYWHVSPWIGIAGYAMAATTGFMRLYNNAHWLNDVIAGAGLGILCAEAAYWLYPVITKTFFKKRYNANLFLSPSLSSSGVGLACCISL